MTRLWLAAEAVTDGDLPSPDNNNSGGSSAIGFPAKGDTTAGAAVNDEE